MRGFPLLRLALVAAALGLFAIPVWSLTRAKPVNAPDAPSATKQETAEFSVSLAASSPAALRVTAANQPAASSEPGVLVFETRFAMDAERPEDLAVSADFSDKSRSHAVRVEVRSGERILADTTLWGSGSVEDVVEIPPP